MSDKERIGSWKGDNNERVQFKRYKILVQSNLHGIVRLQHAPHDREDGATSTRQNTAEIGWAIRFLLGIPELEYRFFLWSGHGVIRYIFGNDRAKLLWWVVFDYEGKTFYEVSTHA